MANLEVLAHKQVEGGAGVHADGADAAATVSQKSQAQVGTKLRVFLEKQLRKLSQDPERCCSALLGGSRSSQMELGRASAHSDCSQ
jgi:hypothetical protein